METAELLIVDDHPLIRSGLRALLESEPRFRVRWEAGSIHETVRLLGTARPDLAIIDISLPDGNGLDLIKRFRVTLPATRVLVLSIHNEILLAERALHQGAMGYLCKDESPDNILNTLHRILAGKISVSAHLEPHLRNSMGRVQRPQQLAVQTLSTRELEVFDLVGRGLATGEIASCLHLSVKTIESHRANIKRKLRLETSGELARHAMMWSLAGNQ